ncbi:MAG: hypothetical protein ACRBBK_07025 [Paracoccaceae bacterium]
MNKFLALGMVAALAAGCMGAVQLPASVEANLPADVPAKSVMQGADGCYSYEYEGLTFPLTNAEGVPVCL